MLVLCASPHSSLRNRLDNKQAVENEIEMTRRLLVTGIAGAAQKLISLGADIRQRYMGRHLLSWAVYGNCPSEAAVLLDAGADVNATGTDGASALSISVKQGKTSLVRLLAERGASVGLTDRYGKTEMHVGARWGFAEICQILAAADAVVDVGDKTGNAPLHDAAFSGRIDACRVLVELGADPHRTALDGGTPLHAVAKGGGNVETCRFFVGLGLDPNQIAVGVGVKAGLSPFQEAVRAGNVDAVLYFARECGCDLAERSVAGQTMIRLAARHPDMKHVLRAHETTVAVAGAISATRAGRAPVDPSSAAQDRSGYHSPGMGLL
jgi:ankyrin repeat protein